MPEISGQKRQLNPNDFVTSVESIVSDMLVYYRHYSGKVMAIDDKMVVKLYVEELNAKESDKSTWIPARPATILQSFMPVKVGQFVEFYFKSGSPSNARYIGIDPLTYTSENGGTNKYVLFEFGDASIVYNANTSKLEIKSGTADLEKTLLGETLQEELDKDLDLMTELQTAINNWIPTPMDGGAGLKTALGTFLGLPQADYSDILSENTKNN